MTIRNLCYRHSCQEVDKLPNAMRHLAASWGLVSAEECELCQEAEPRPDIVAVAKEDSDV